MKIVVTGASSGIGYQTALLLSQQGHQVFAVARNKENLQKLRNEAGSEHLHILAGDINDDTFNQHVIDEINLHAGRLDVIINNAGILINKPFEDLTDEDWFIVYGTNVFGVVKLIRSLSQFFSTTVESNGRGHILNISSMGGFQGSAKFKGLSAYSSSKAALVGLTECLAEEFKERKIAVNCLCLGSVQTEMFSTAFPAFTASTTAEEMAAFICNFALNGHRLFNGKIIPVSSSTP